MLKKKVSLDNEALSFAKSKGIDQQTQLSAITLRKFMTTVILAEFLCDKKKKKEEMHRFAGQNATARLMRQQYVILLQRACYCNAI